MEDVDDGISVPEGQQTLVKYNSPESLTTFTLSELAEKPGFTPDGDPIPTYSILNAILPPLQWESHGTKWRQTVSSVPATRSDVISLQERLDRRLKEQKARELGIDHVRRGLYTQFFDELIRQVAIESSERGILLDRIKTEFIQTIRAYEAIYKNAVGYGIRKRMTLALTLEELEKNLYEYPLEVEELQTSNANLRKEVQDTRDAGAATRETLLARREEELAEMRETNEAVKVQIWSVLFPRKAGN